MSDKRASKPLSIYWFAILVIVAGGIAYIVSIFYSAPYDIRETEANILENNLINCLVKNNYFDSEIFLLANSEDFFEKCRISLNSDDYPWQERELQYYLEVSVFDFNSLQPLENGSFSGGNINLHTYCDISQKRKEEPPFCLRDSIYALGNNQEKYKINFVVVVDKNAKNV